ncbi:MULTISPECIES: bifunctional 2-methylcitrate synthase/citrate synthase [unclassified Pseudofrankia]|uniref:bifunctional 2-methylcitrate synthase/citrate synthase n=1 Tax=unclassified Pseudofrankia TaxID=2994372 RepID=UPI0008DA3115|nr:MULTISPECIES: bifunctional 2-methylcitrate synthase/citrate synthase [unclassified Pseudofrankia]MDT3446629.1 bifunctional 2-methylcitrate synthase/citrate synthase [Pseudofrankia sp. BMG5.37]OHV58645.1 2-methylcitrate synthase [Pseudofrankia sp. BMG5.36]
MTTVEPSVRKGLAGVVVDTTSVSMVNPETNSLTYRGYPVQQLAAEYSFEEVAYLIWYGELPTTEQLCGFTEAERARRSIDRTLMGLLARLPETCHPMDVLRTAVSYLGAQDPTEDDGTVEANRIKALDLMAKLPTVVALDQRRRRGQEPILPDPTLGFAGNFFHMCFGEVPDPEAVRAFDVSLILYAEHSFNASTFTARVVTSTLSDLYSAVTAGIGALKGPLHGGANEAVMNMIDEIGDPADAERWMLDALANKRKVMGFGHRVYKAGDSRVPTMRAELDRVAKTGGEPGERLMAIYTTLETVMLRERNLHPNLDFPAGPAYHLMGFDIPTFTPIFVMSRITGWTAHIIEQLAANTLIRPLSSYVGVGERSVPLAARRLAGSAGLA